MGVTAARREPAPTTRRRRADSESESPESSTAPEFASAPGLPRYIDAASTEVPASSDLMSLDPSRFDSVVTSHALSSADAQIDAAQSAVRDMSVSEPEGGEAPEAGAEAGVDGGGPDSTSEDGGSSEASDAGEAGTAEGEAAGDAETPGAEAEGEAGESEGEGGRGRGVDSSSADIADGGGGAAGADPMAALTTGDLAMIDTELAEHLRWGDAAERVGTAGSAARADFILQQAGSGALGGLGHGFGMGALVGGGTRALEIGGGRLVSHLVSTGRIATRLTGPALARTLPLPAIGAVIGGVFSAIDLATRDWSHTGETIGRFGEGGSIYEQLANSIAAVSEIIGIATAVLNVIGGIIGAISIAMWIITVATVGVASPLAATLSTIAGVIGIVSMILDGINALVLQRLVTLFRALHTFTSQADPTDVEAQGGRISEAAGASFGFIGGVAGGLAGSGAVGRGARGRGWVDAEGHIPDVDPPRTGAGDGPRITADPPPPGARDAPALPVSESPGSRASAMPEVIGPEAPLLMADTADAPGAPPRPEYHPEGFVPPEVNQPLPGPPPIEVPPVMQGPLPEGVTRHRNPADLFLPDTPELGGTHRHDIRIDPEVRRDLGHNVESDHALSQAEMQDRLRGEPGARAPEGALRPVSLGESATVLAETGKATATRPRLPHTEVTFSGPTADAPRVRARREGAPLSGHLSTDLVGPSREVRLGAGYREGPMDVSIVDMLGTAHEQYRPNEVNRALAGLEVAEGRPATPDVPFNEAALDAELGAAFPTPEVAPREPHVWAVLDPVTGEPRPATSAEIMSAIARDKRPGVAPAPGEAQRVPRSTVEPAGPVGPGGHGGPDAPGGGSGTLPMTEDPILPMAERSPTRSTRPLTQAEFEAHARMIHERYGVPMERIERGPRTGYNRARDVVIIGPDVNPLPAAERPTVTGNPANLAAEAPAVLAHEVVGHRDAALAGQRRAPDPRPGHPAANWHEEFQASTRAALLEPNLTPEARRNLMLDAEARRRHAPNDDTIFVWTEAGESSVARSTPETPRTGSPPRAPGELPSVIVNLDEPGGSGTREFTDAETSTVRTPTVPVEAPVSSSVLPAVSAGVRSSEAERRARGGTGSASGVGDGAGGGAGTTVEARAAPRAEGTRRSAAFREGARAGVRTLDPSTPALYDAYFGSGTRESRIGRGGTIGLVAGAVLGGPGGAYIGSRVGEGVARRAEDFHEGFERGSQPIVEPVNPAYPSPPGSGDRQEVVDMQNRLIDILQERAQAEALEGMMCSDAEHHEANSEPLADFNTRTEETITATQAHERAVAERAAAHERRKSEEESVISTIGDYSDRAAGLTVIKTPLEFFTGFTYLAHALPDSPEVLVGAKRGILQMNTDGQNFLNALNGVDSAMAEQQTAQPARSAEVEANTNRLEDTSSAAETSQSQLGEAQSGGAALADTNDARAADSRQRETQAAQAGAQLDGQADQSRTEITDLSMQWQTWAQAHRQARVDAMAATRAAMIERGWTPTAETTGVP